MFGRRGAVEGKSEAGTAVTVEGREQKQQEQESQQRLAEEGRTRVVEEEGRELHQKLEQEWR